MHKIKKKRNLRRGWSERGQEEDIEFWNGYCDIEISPLTLWLVIAFESEMENVSTMESNRTSFFGWWAFLERGQSEHMAESVGVVGGIFDEYIRDSLRFFFFHYFFLSLSLFLSFLSLLFCFPCRSDLFTVTLHRVTFLTSLSKV